MKKAKKGENKLSVWYKSICSKFHNLCLTYTSLEREATGRAQDLKIKADVIQKYCA